MSVRTAAVKDITLGISPALQYETVTFTLHVCQTMVLLISDYQQVSTFQIEKYCNIENCAFSKTSMLCHVCIAIALKIQPGRTTEPGYTGDIGAIEI